MIKARFFRKKNLFSVEIRGHSGFAPQGEDIVCAAVSAGFLYLEAMLLDCGGEIISKKEESGFGAISFAGGEREEGAYLMLFAGLRRLAKAYPEFVSVEQGGLCKKEETAEERPKGKVEAGRTLQKGRGRRGEPQGKDRKKRKSFFEERKSKGAGG